jgi:tetratricopeptide (TPR) repeat protein
MVDICGELGDKRGALEGFRKALAVNEDLVAVDPANARACSDLARLSEAVAAYRQKQGIIPKRWETILNRSRCYQKASAKAPEDLHQRVLLAISQAGVGRMQAALGQKASALENCQKTISLLEKVTEEPTNVALRNLKAQAYQHLGEVYSAIATSKEGSGEIRQLWTAARDIFQRSLDIWDDMRSRGIFPAQTQANAMKSCAKSPNATRICRNDHSRADMICFYRQIMGGVPGISFTGQA